MALSSSAALPAKPGVSYKSVCILIFLLWSRQDSIPGDMTAVSRGVYKHWAIYVEDGRVVHVTISGKDELFV